MTSKNLIRLVARAICGRGCDMPDCTCQPEHGRARCQQLSIEDAERAIEMIKISGYKILKREPTEAMLEAFVALRSPDMPEDTQEQRDAFRGAYRRGALMAWQSQWDVAE